jgi:hypothetical protein
LPLDAFNRKASGDYRRQAEDGYANDCTEEPAEHRVDWSAD